MIGLPVLAAVSAPSSLAASLAETGLTLVGFLRGATMNVYAGAQRVTAERLRRAGGSGRLRGLVRERSRLVDVGASGRDLLGQLAAIATPPGARPSR